MAKPNKIEANWFDILKDKITNFYESFDFSNENLIRIATAAGIGFGLGISFKKFRSLIFIGVVLTILSLYGLEQFNFITINLEKIKLFLGFTYKATLYDVANLYLDWIKDHMVLTVSFCISFLIGYRVG